MDVISTDKTGENFRLIYDTKGRFAVHRITPEEAKYKLCKVRKIFVGTKGIPHLVTQDARTICYPDPLIKVNDTIQIDLETGKIIDFIKFDTGNLCMVTGGANLGRIGVITNRERHLGSFAVVQVCVRCERQQLCHTALEHFRYWQRQQTMDLSSPWKGYSPYHC